MPVYARLQNFLGRVHAANPRFERIKSSSLRPLINILSNPTGNANQVENALPGIPALKTARYLDALYYLLATYPGLSANAASRLNMPPLLQTNAARYIQTPLPNGFNPQGQQNARVYVTPPSQFENCTVEQFVLANAANTRILLIHLSDWLEEMEMRFNGRTVIQHIKSVLYIARLKNCPLSVLTKSPTTDVCPALLAEYNRFGNVERVYERRNMGTGNQNLCDFASGCTNLVVMGFDATVCVFANVFGGNELMPDNSFMPPLSTLTNIVMSRATLVTRGIITVGSATRGQAEYGPLYHT